MALQFSFIIPVYNRPNEVLELLQSFVGLKTTRDFEVVIVEDGSTMSSKYVVEQFSTQLNVVYYFKENSGPGDSRNFGMRQAKGNYFIILDSDCLLPEHYLNAVEASLEANYVDCFGGPDAAHDSFSNLQKAINFSMTSILTTGGIRGNKKSVDRFQPRSFNMGISKLAFEASKGFGNIHPGEDPDLTIRLSHLGFKTKLIPEAFVYHKRRISWGKFYNQVKKFGIVRSILNSWHPQTKKITYWFPTLFCVGFMISVALVFVNFKWLLGVYLGYFVLLFLSALSSTKHLGISINAILATGIQFFGYGIGFFKGTIAIEVFKKNPKVYFPTLFFKK